MAEGGSDRENLRQALRRMLEAWGERAAVLRDMAVRERRAERPDRADDFDRTATLLERRCGVIQETLAGSGA